MKPINMQKYFKAHRLDILVISLFYLLILFSSMAIPYLLGRTITHLEQGTITRVFILIEFSKVIIVYVLWNLFSALMEVKFEKTNKQIENKLRVDCVEIILNAKYAHYAKLSKGEILNKITSDTRTIEKAFSNGFSWITAIIHSLTILVVMFLINSRLALIVTVFFIIIVLIQKITSKSMKSLFLKYKAADELFFRKIRNILNGFKTIKVYSLEETALHDLSESGRKTYEDHVKITKSQSVIKNINFFFSSVFRSSTIFIGGLLYLGNLVTIGQIFTLHSYSIHLAAHLRRIIELDIILKDIKTSIERINYFLMSFEKEPEIEKIDTCVESILFKNVKFRYDGTPVFDNINFLAEKGDIISICGPNGAGKSTLATIITGLQYDEGEIYYNDFKSSSTDVSIRDRVAIVDQTSYLFPDTILNNLTCFDESKVDLAMSIIEVLNISSRFKNFKNGLETVISEENENLSGGEKQLISILRALISDRDIIVLDEFTSSLDVGLKRDLLKNLKGFLANKITFVISHDDETQSMCTKRIELTKF